MAIRNEIYTDNTTVDTINQHIGYIVDDNTYPFIVKLIAKTYSEQDNYYNWMWLNDALNEYSKNRKFIIYFYSHTIYWDEYNQRSKAVHSDDFKLVYLMPQSLMTIE